MNLDTFLMKHLASGLCNKNLFMPQPFYDNFYATNQIWKHENCPKMQPLYWHFSMIKFFNYPWIQRGWEVLCVTKQVRDACIKDEETSLYRDRGIVNIYTYLLDIMCLVYDIIVIYQTFQCSIHSWMVWPEHEHAKCDW